MQFRYDLEELRRLQGLNIDQKVALSMTRIQEWYEHYEGKVSVSYSGGKDSTVLLHLVRSMYPEVPAVYADTRLDLPEVRGFVKKTPNVIFVKPVMDFREVIKTYGWCFPSKEVAKYIEDARRGVKYAVNGLQGLYLDGTPSKFCRDRLTRWAFLVDAPFKISPMCCKVMKERPLDEYKKKTGNFPFIGLMATESKRRELTWRKVGCNAFDINRPSSKPLSFWTEQDIWTYILWHGIEIPSCYGDIITKNGKLKCSGEQRTGCAFCLIGAHRDKKSSRIKRLKDTHPALYKYCMEHLGMKEVLEWLKIPH